MQKTNLQILLTYYNNIYIFNLKKLLYHKLHLEWLNNISKIFINHIFVLLIYCLKPILIIYASCSKLSYLLNLCLFLKFSFYLIFNLIYLC